MDTSRGLVEAQTFGRRCLVSALVSGAPGGSEAGCSPVARPLLAGLALSVLLVAGVAARDALAAAAADDTSGCTTSAR